MKQTDLIFLLLLNKQDRLHFEIQDQTLFLMAGTTSKIAVPITLQLFDLVHTLRKEIANTLSKEDDETNSPDQNSHHPLLILQRAKNRQTQSMPSG